MSTIRALFIMLGASFVMLAVALALSAAGGQDSLATDGTIYVDADATGLGNGTSWADAFTTLQPALTAATVGDEVWVAGGIYTPTLEFSPGDPRSASFQMKTGVALYGGFDPTVGDIAWEDRDWVLHETILSGDLNGDDVPPFGNNGENSYHVFYHPWGTALDSSAILDGFIVTGGNSDDGGGGMYNDDSSPTLINCTFSGNSAKLEGGGISNYYIYASPTLINCIFEGNSAWWGGGIYNDASGLTLTDCVFSGNLADAWGGGMVNSSSPTLTNCIFEGNSAGGGGGMYNKGWPTLNNCTFAGNSADIGAGIYNWGAGATLTNCTFHANSAGGGGGMYNDGASPTLTNCILWGDSPDEILDNVTSSPVVTYSDIQGGYDGVGNIAVPPFFVNPGNGDFHLGACSPCIDTGDNSAAGLPDYDFEGDDRILDGNGDGTSTVDMGVDEVASAGTCFRVYLPVVLRNAP